jgi:glutathione synthase/RimK-type ligase-like ATP-grasp enzyme
VNDSNLYLIGFAGLARMLESGIDFRELGPRLEARIKNAPRDANALMDLSTLLFLSMNADFRSIAFEKQQRALDISRVYRLRPRTTNPALRLLVVMAPGDMTANTPVDCLLEDSDVEITMFYVVPGHPLPQSLPDHDLILVAIGESDGSSALLQQLAGLSTLSTKPVINSPDKIRALTRNRVSTLLKSVPGAAMPVTARVERDALLKAGREKRLLGEILEHGRYPIIVRPVSSHGGKDLSKIDNAADLAAYVDGLSDAEFYISNFIDYRSADGQFRKIRVVMFDGRPFACHMAISSNWMVHYFNADMAGSPSKREEEAQFMEGFHTGFSERHKTSLRSIYRLLGLDFIVLDCAETQDGTLLIFEVDTAAIVHALDDPALYPYKKPEMAKAFEAFRQMLATRVNQQGGAAH